MFARECLTEQKKVFSLEYLMCSQSVLILAIKLQGGTQHVLNNFHTGYCLLNLGMAWLSLSFIPYIGTLPWSLLLIQISLDIYNIYIIYNKAADNNLLVVLSPNFEVPPPHREKKKEKTLTIEVTNLMYMKYVSFFPFKWPFYF